MQLKHILALCSYSNTTHNIVIGSILQDTTTLKSLLAGRPLEADTKPVIKYTPEPALLYLRPAYTGSNTDTARGAFIRRSQRTLEAVNTSLYDRAHTLLPPQVQAGHLYKLRPVAVCARLSCCLDNIFPYLLRHL